MSKGATTDFRSAWKDSGIGTLGEDAMRMIMKEMSQSRFGKAQHNGSLLFPDISHVDGETMTFAQLTKDDKAMKKKLIASKKLLARASEDDPEWLSGKLNELSAWKRLSSLATGTSGPGATTFAAPWTKSNMTLHQWFRKSTKGLDSKHLAELHNRFRSGPLTSQIRTKDGTRLFGKARKGMDPSERDPTQYATIKSISSAFNPTVKDETSRQIASEVTAESEWIAKTLNNMRSAAGGAKKKAPKSSAGDDSSRARSSSPSTRSGASTASKDPFGDLDTSEFATGRSNRSESKSRGSRPLATESEKSRKPTTDGGGEPKRAMKKGGQRARMSEHRTAGYRESTAGSASTGPDWADTLHGEPQSEFTQSRLSQRYSVPPSVLDPRNSAPPPTWSHQPGSAYPPMQPYRHAMPHNHAFSGLSTVPSMTQSGYIPTGPSYSAHGGPVSTQTVYDPTGAFTRLARYGDGTLVEESGRQPTYPLATSNYWSQPGYSGIPMGSGISVY